MRKTKIVCTIGPSSEKPEVFRELCRNGLNVARLNFSHGTHEEHQKKIDMIKRGGYALAEEMSTLVRTELRKNAFPTTERVRQLDELFIRRNLSPGGCADLLAVSYFLHDWKQAFKAE